MTTSRSYDETVDGDVSEILHAGGDGIEAIAAHILETHVNAVPTLGFQGIGQCFFLAVDTTLEASS